MIAALSPDATFMGRRIHDMTREQLFSVLAYQTIEGTRAIAMLPADKIFALRLQMKDVEVMV